MPQTHCYATGTVTLLWKFYRVHRSCHQGNPTCNSILGGNSVLFYENYFLRQWSTQYASKSKSSPTTHLWRRRGERMYNSYSFTTSALDGGGQHHAPAALYLPENDHWYPLYRRLGGPQRQSWHRNWRKISCYCRGSNLDRPVVQFVARHYTDWATSGMPVIFVLHSDIT
jgi:hypothetical protein